MKKSLILLILLLVLGAVFYAYKSYNKPHIDIADTKATITIYAADLFAAFDTDESHAMQQYADQVVAVKGTLLNRDLSNDLEPQIVLEGNGDNGFIRCGFKKEELQKVITLTDGATVEVKGMCMGMNGSEELDLLADKDVVLSNCIIIE